MPDRSRQRFRVVGRVQGVGFRWWVREQARRLELDGFVRNATDGSVEVEAEGEPKALQSLRQLLQQGPPAARVMALEELAPSATRLPRPFDAVG
jgi:acylphosphatase